MKKQNKLPKKQKQTMNIFSSMSEGNKYPETDPTTITLSTVTSTHIFQK